MGCVTAFDSFGMRDLFLHGVLASGFSSSFSSPLIIAPTRRGGSCLLGGRTHE
jgi:hypothetical protein